MKAHLHWKPGFSGELFMKVGSVGMALNTD